ncbi:hypothetical protein B0H14DRAFT_1327135 [Mycena olivaceomarginata]|nr:hypothetical protein B0H14DRAFT_1327135 [Mycena olivaceomarginata]
MSGKTSSSIASSQPGSTASSNTAPDDYVEGDKIEPASWNFQSAARFSPHQCEVFAEKFLSVIRSNEFPLHTRVRATEQFTRLPTTTIHELAALLTKDNLNPRISEAILMFLPRLDEPAAGIQFLLAPAILAGELARTAVYSVKRSLEYVPLASVPTFLEPPTVKPLKIGVFKELVRIITTYLELPEMQDLVKRLWARRLHQDVRITLLQSLLPALDSPHQDLAWYIIDEATASLSTLQADDTLFVLLAVTPEVSTACGDDVLRTYLNRSPVLVNMATVTIPKAHCERYVETVLWPLTRIRLNPDLAESIKDDKKRQQSSQNAFPSSARPPTSLVSIRSWVRTTLFHLQNGRQRILRALWISVWRVISPAITLVHFQRNSCSST